MNNNRLANLAKNKKLDNKKKKISVSDDEVIIKEPKSPEEVRDMKAKKKIEELLEDVNLNINKEDNIQDEEEEIVESKEHGEGVEWLEEQVVALTSENEILTNELFQAREDYTKIFERFQNNGDSPNNLMNETLVQNVLYMYNELQNNFTGNNQEHQRWSIVQIQYLLNQMNSLFPFLENYKRY